MTPRRGDDGSLMIAVMLIALVGGLLLVLSSTVLMSSGTTRRGDTHAQAVALADAAVQQALYEANAGKPTPPQASPRTATFKNGSYSWWAEETDATTRVVHASSKSGRTAQKLRVVIKSKISTGPVATIPGTAPGGSTETTAGRPFADAVFGDSAVTLRGNNVVDSYDSSKSSPTFSTGQGSVGSNRAIVLRGNATADKLKAYNNASCDGADCETKLVGYTGVRDLGEAHIAAGIAACNNNFKPYIASVNGPLLAGTHCFSSMLFDVNVQVLATPAVPAVAFVTGTVSVLKGVQVNAGNVMDVAGAPKAARLQIYSSGAAVSIGNSTASTTKAAWLLAAPYASCSGNPSNASAEIYGAIICKEVTNQGGWRLHYDASAANVSVTPPPAPVTSPSPLPSGEAVIGSGPVWDIFRYGEGQ